MKKFTLVTVAIGLGISLSYGQNLRIDSDLNTVELDNLDLSQVQNALTQLSDVRSELESEMELSVPDYKPVYYSMQSKISKSLVSYVNKIDDLNLKIKKDLTRLDALGKLNASSVQYQDLYNKELQRVLPKIESYLNPTYQKAIKELYTLDGFLSLAVKQRKNNYKNIFKKTVDGRTKLESLCYTSICLGKIKEDIAQWINLVDSMNVDIESERETINLKPSPRQVSSINHFSTAINDFTNSLIKVELDSNKTYTTSEAALTYLGQVAKSSLGVSSAIVLFPFKLINNTLRGVSKLKVDGKFIIKDLSFEKLKTYDLDDSINDFLSTADSLKTEIGITVGEEEAREYLIKSLEKQSSERDFILREVMPKDVEFKEKVQTLYPEYFMNRKPEERSELLNTLNSKDKKCFNYTVRRGFKKGRVVPICAKVSGLSVKDISLYNNGYDNFRASRFNAKLICKGLGFSGYKKIEKKEYSFYRGAYRLQNLNLVSRDELPSFWSTMKSIECKY